jgi:hypothetical protein
MQRAVILDDVPRPRVTSAPVSARFSGDPAGNAFFAAHFPFTPNCAFYRRRTRGRPSPVASVLPPETKNMRKLRLSIETLQVESFHAEQPAPGRDGAAALSGTQEPNDCPASQWYTCAAECSLYATHCGTCNDPTCGPSCNTCGYSCAATQCGCPSNFLSECACQTWETCPGAMCV